MQPRFLLHIFFEQEDGKALTVNTARYVAMLEQVFDNETLDNLYDHFYHISLVALAWVEDNFPGRLISIKSDFPCPPNSPHLNPLNYYLWGHVKAKLLFEANPQLVDQIKETDSS